MPRTVPVRAILLVAALVQVAFQLTLVGGGVDAVVAKLTPDDLFYYLQTAWNLKELGFPTFDGINSTNGVQFLWYWVLVVFAAVIPSKSTLILVTLGACVALNVASYYPIARIGRALGRPVVTVLLAAGWLYLNGRFYVSGLENSLHALLVWTVLWQLLELREDLEHEAQSRRRLMVVSGLLVLLVWTRLDSVFYAVPLFLYCVALVRRHHPAAWLPWTLRSGGLAVAGAAVMLGTYHWMAGWPLPVSGLVKQGLYSWQASTLWFVTFRGLYSTSPFFDALQLALPARIGGPIAGVLAIAMVGGLVAVALRTSYLKDASLRQHVPLYGVLAASMAAHLVYLASLGGYAEHGYWYQSPYYVFCIVTFALTIDACAHALETTRLRRWTPALATALSAFVVVAALGASTYRFFGRDKLEDYPNRHRLEVARWVAANLEPDAVCASWNAGQFGYFSEHPVVHMEGLVNSIAYYRWLRSGNVKELDYLLEHDIAYVVDYHMPGHVREALPLVKSFKASSGAKKGRVYEIRRNPTWQSKIASDVPAASSSEPKQ